MRSGIQWVRFAIFAALGCAQSPPPSEPSAVAVSPPPAESPAPETPTPARSDIPQSPWSVGYHDGSGNAFQFEQSSRNESARYTYSPVTPERSSTGMYSGGEPAAGTLDSEQTAGLWKRLLQLEAETSLHTDQRDKGTGAFQLVTPAGKRSFIVSRGDLLGAFDEFLTPLKKP